LEYYINGDLRVCCDKGVEEKQEKNFIFFNGDVIENLLLTL